MGERHYQFIGGALTDDSRREITCDNQAFLWVLQRQCPGGNSLWITQFPQDPAHGTWGGEAWEPTKSQWREDNNCYFSIGAIRSGTHTRSDATFGALLAVVLDDVGVKVALEVPKPDPSWVIETSPRSFQFGYILREPLTDSRMAKSLVGGLADKGFTDPGAGGIVRYMRLPEGVNAKLDVIAANGGQPYRTRLRHFDPDCRYSWTELADVFGIGLTRKRGRPAIDPYQIGTDSDPVYAVLSKLDLLTGRPAGPSGFHGMRRCPQEHLHTGGTTEGTSAGYKPGGFFRCLHGHCTDLRIEHLLAWLRAEHGINTDELIQRMPGTAGAVLRAVNRYVYVKDVEAFVDLHTGTIDTKTALDDYYFAAAPEHKFSHLLLRRDDLRRSERTVYRPGAPLLLEEEGRSAVNQWLPGKVVAAEVVEESRVQLWLDHLAWLYHDASDQLLVLDFLTHLVQRRGHKINWALVLLAREQGTGRDTLATPIRLILGPRNVAHIDGADLESDFNDYLLSELVFASELDTAEGSRRRIYRKLKGPVAKPPDHVRVNVKFIPARDMPKVSNFLIFTNDPAAVALDDGDRRFAVVETQRTRAEVLEYSARGAFRELHGAYREPGWVANLYAYLLKRQISPAFDPDGRAPETTAKQKMMRAAEDPAKTRLREWMVSRDGPFAGDLFEVRSVVTRLAAEGYRAEGRIVEMFLRDLGAEYIKEVRAGAIKVRLWAARDIALYAEMAERPAVLARAYERALADARQRDQDVMDELLS